jgi:urease accessory protein
MDKRLAEKTMLSVALMIVFSSSADAPTGASPIAGFGNGFVHPFLGPDHLLTMIAVGWWAVRLGGANLWAMPLAFMTFMAVGALLYGAGLGVPYAEWLVSLSVIAMGFMLARKVSGVAPLVGIFTMAFAVFHGFVHAAEIGPHDSALSYAAGFMLATGTLHGIGIVAGLGLRDTPRQAFGVLCAGLGLCLLAGF